MREYDEYQKFMRYKYGYHSFFILLILLSINFFIDFQWAYTEKDEAIIIVWVASIYFVVRSVFDGAYYGKWENPVAASLLSSIPGLLYLSDYIFDEYILFENGRLAENPSRFFVGLFWLSIPVTYFIRMIFEKIREKKDLDVRT